MTDQKTPDGPQERLEGPSGHAETLEGRNGPQRRADGFQGEQQPRGPVDWARHQAAEREQQAVADPNAIIRAAKFTAAHWHHAALDRDDIPMAHAIACILAALAGEARPDQLGLAEDAHDAFRAALADPAPAPAATEATDGCTSACRGLTGIRGLLEHVGIDTTVAGRIVDTAPAHNTGPSIREAAADDRAYWERKDAGETP